MPAKRLPDQDVRDMVEEGKTNKEIAQSLLGPPHYIEVTPEAIGMWKRRRGYPATTLRYDDLLPWVVHESHAKLYAATMLRMEARRRRGLPLTERNQKLLSSWLQKLKEQNVVVWYEENDPTGQGWYYFPREDRDTDIIRKPEHMVA
jgi:hypothetical protein